MKKINISVTQKELYNIMAALIMASDYDKKSWNIYKKLSEQCPTETVDDFNNKSFRCPLCDTVKFKGKLTKLYKNSSAKITCCNECLKARKS